MASGYVVLTLKFKKENRRWTAYCEELGTATFGRSLPEADRRLKELIPLHIDALEDVGERERFFKENGITVYKSKPKDDINICLSANRDVFVEPHIQALQVLVSA